MERSGQGYATQLSYPPPSTPPLVVTCRRQVMYSVLCPCPASTSGGHFGFRKQPGLANAWKLPAGYRTGVALVRSAVFTLLHHSLVVKEILLFRNWEICSGLGESKVAKSASSQERRTRAVDLIFAHIGVSSTRRPSPGRTTYRMARRYLSVPAHHQFILLFI